VKTGDENPSQQLWTSAAPNVC